MDTRSITALINTFFTAVTGGQKRIALGRTMRVRAHLHEHIDAIGERTFDDDMLALLELERQFTKVGAVELIATPFHLMCMLPSFVNVKNLLPARLDASAQLRLVREFQFFLRPLFEYQDIEPVLKELYLQLHRSRQHLRRLLQDQKLRESGIDPDEYRAKIERILTGNRPTGER